MPKALDKRIITAIKKAYLERNPRPTLKALADEFGVGRSTVNALSCKGKWAAQRDAKDAATATGKAQGAIVATRARPKLNDIDLLNNAIADISAEVAAIEAKSKEGCATALANLLKAKRELYPPDAEGLAELAVKLDISPNDFLEALRAKWSGELQHQSESVNGGKVQQPR